MGTGACDLALTLARRIVARKLGSERGHTLKSPRFTIVGAGIAAFLLAYAAVPLIAAKTTSVVKHESALPESAIPIYIVDAVNSPDRPATDKKLDTSRHPDQLMAFFGVKPGMQVADIWAAAGYTTEVLAR